MDLPADARRLPDHWQSLRNTLVARATTSHIAVFTGADHHAAHADICRLRDLVAELESDADVVISRLDEFFAAASPESALVPALRGELRWSYGYTWTLQGVHATRAALKRRHTEAELWLERTAEPLAALASVVRPSRSHPVLREAWRTLLRSQFHDSIAGCTSDDVARRVVARIEDAEVMARESARLSLNALTGNDPDRARDDPEKAAPALVLWNGTPRRRGGVVVADLTAFVGDVLVGPPGARTPRRGRGFHDVSLSGPNGPVPVQVLGRTRGQERLDSARHYPDQDEVEIVRVAFETPELPGFAAATLAPAGRRSPAATGLATARKGLIENGLVEVAVDRAGAVRLRDLVTGEVFPGLLRLESGGDRGDTYSYSAPPRDRLAALVAPVETRVLASGPLVAALEVTGRMRLATGTVEVRLVLALHHGSPALRISLEIDNQASNHRLRLRFPTGVAGGTAVAGSAFGATERPLVHADPARYAREAPVATAPAHRFVAHAAGQRGLAVLAPGFFEYELTEGGDLVVTILRAVGELSRNDLAERPGHAGWPTATPEAQCRGAERMQFAVHPITAPATRDGTTLPTTWEDVFLPPRAVWLRQAPSLRLAAIDCTLGGEGIVFSALKPAERGDGIVLRCYNARRSAASGSCRLSIPLASAARVRADEQWLQELDIEENRRTVRFHAGAHEIVTLLLRPALPSRKETD